MADLQSDDVVDRVTAAMRELIDEPVDGRKIAGLEKKLASPTAKIGKLVDLLADADELAAKAYKRSISLAEAERATQVDALAAMRRSAEQHLGRTINLERRRMAPLEAATARSGNGNDCGRWEINKGRTRRPY